MACCMDYMDYALRIPTQMLIGYFVHCTYIHMHITKQPVGHGFWDVRQTIVICKKTGQLWILDKCWKLDQNEEPLYLLRMQKEAKHSKNQLYIIFCVPTHYIPTRATTSHPSIHSNSANRKWQRKTFTIMSQLRVRQIVTLYFIY